MNEGANNRELEVGISSPYIEQVVGADRGRAVTLSGEKMTIGRADGNDIVVQSEGVSRLHAYLMQSDGQWYIRDNGSKNGILVNGQKVVESWLQNGDVVQVGNFVFRFNDPSAQAAQPAETPIAEMAGAGMPDFGAGTGMVEMPKRKTNPRIIIWVVVLGGLVYYLQMGDGSSSGTASSGGEEDGNAATATYEQKRSLAMQKQEELVKISKDIEEAEANKADPEVKQELLRKQSALQTEVSKLSRTVIGIEDPELKEAEKYMEKLDWSNSSLREAEQFFRKGQREYLNGSFQRAIDSFETALSFYRGHRLAENYLRRTYYEVEAEARKHMDMGIQYFESLQYKRALNHFSEVVALMAHRSTDNMVAQAEKYGALCRRRLQAAELFQ